jgi:4-hydroxybenzoyl-CoA reductase subunit alpha
MTGHATKEAAVDVRRQILGVLARELKVDHSELDIMDGLIVFKHGRVDFGSIRARYIKEHRGWEGLARGRDPLTFQEAARIAYLARGSIIGRGKYKPGELGGTHKGAAVGTSPAYGCSAQVVEVSVDLETGRITVEKMTDAHDCGFAINRTSVEGQMQGLSVGRRGPLRRGQVQRKRTSPESHLAEYKIATSGHTQPIDHGIPRTHGPFGEEVGEEPSCRPSPQLNAATTTGTDSGTARHRAGLMASESNTGKRKETMMSRGVDLYEEQSAATGGS